MTLIISDKFCL